eukprot:gene5684-9505_t
MNKLFKRLSLAKRPEQKKEDEVEISGPTGFVRTVRGSLNSDGDLLGQEDLLKAMEEALANNQPISYDTLLALKPVQNQSTPKPEQKKEKRKSSLTELSQEQDEEEENPVLRKLQEQKERESKKE